MKYSVERLEILFSEHLSRAGQPSFITFLPSQAKGQTKEPSIVTCWGRPRKMFDSETPHSHLSFLSA